MRRLLGVLAALLAVVVGVEGWYLAGGTAPVVTADRPVVVGEQVGRASVDEAARQTAAILSYGFEDFEAQLADATDRMTTAFADEFAARVDAERRRFAAQRVTQEVRVVASSVVTASDDKVRSLLFLDQYVARAGAGTTVRPFRVLVTTVREDGRWLIADIELL